jgi:fucose permease
MLVIAAILAVFVYGMIAAMLGTILPDFSQRFHLSPRQNGKIALVQALGLIAASVFTGPLIDCQGTKAGLLLGLGLAAAALLLLAGSKRYGSVALSLFLLGLGGGCIVNGAFALAASIPGNTARTFNLVTLFFGLGGMATPFVAANLFRKNSVNLCYFASLVAAAAFALHAAIGMPPARVGFELANTGHVVGSRAFWLLAGMLFLYVSAECGVWNWMPRHLIAQGIAESRALNIMGLGFAPGIAVGRLAVVPLLSSVTPEMVTLGASLAMVATLLVALRSRGGTVAGVAIFCAGLAMAPVFPTVNAMANANKAFVGMQATAMGLCQTFGWTGLAVSSGIIGAIAGGDAGRLKKALLALPVFSLLIALAAVVLIGSPSVVKVP